MRQVLLLIVAAALGSLLGWFGQPMASASVESAAQAAAVYTYDAPVYDAPDNYTETERGPPVKGYANATYDTRRPPGARHFRASEWPPPQRDLRR